MYEEEVAFLAAVEKPEDQTNRRRQPLDADAVERIRQTFPGIPEDYLAYLREIGGGTVRECQHVIYQTPEWCHEDPTFSWFEADGRKLLVVGDNFSGDLFAFDAEHNHRVVELLHETMEVWPFKRGGFKEFIRERMLLGPDGTDTREPIRPALRPAMFVPPCEPVQGDRPPKGAVWMHEVKFDGYRMQVHKDGQKILLFTCNGQDWTDRFPQLASDLAALPTCIIDAELMATEGSGVAAFAALQRIVSKRQEDGLALWAFDLLYADGKDIRDVQCIKRKTRLASIVTSLGSDKLHHSEAFADGERLLSECAERGLEGIVSKRRNSTYKYGVTATWIKVQCQAWREANRGRFKLFKRG